MPLYSKLKPYFFRQNIFLPVCMHFSRNENHFIQTYFFQILIQTDKIKFSIVLRRFFKIYFHSSIFYKYFKTIFFNWKCPQFYIYLSLFLTLRYPILLKINCMEFFLYIYFDASGMLSKNDHLTLNFRTCVFIWMARMKNDFLFPIEKQQSTLET